MSKAKKTAKEPETQTIRLLHPVTLGGGKQPAGSVHEVPLEMARRLVEQELADVA